MVKRLLQHKTFWVMGITLAGMGLSLLVRVLLIPKRFGESDVAVALITALNVVILVDTVVREGAKFSLVPLFVTREKEMTPTKYRFFVNNFLNFFLWSGFAIFILIEFFAPWIASGLLRKSTFDAQRETTLLRLCAPLLVFGCGSTVLGAFLNSRQHFKTVALRNALPAGIAAAVFLLIPNIGNLENWIAMAYTVGFAIYFAYLGIGTYRTGHRYQFTGISVDTLRALKNTVTLPTLGFAIRQVTNRLLIGIYLVSQLGGVAVARYDYAFRIFSALQTLIGISIATTGLPDMATDSAVNDKQKLGRTLNRNARTALIIGFPVALFLLIFHAKIGWLLYGRGKLDDASIELIGHLLFWLSTGMVFSCLIPILNAGLYAQKAYRSVFSNMVTMAVLNFLVAYGLIKILQLRGIAITVSITALLAVGNLTYLLRRTRVSWL